MINAKQIAYMVFVLIVLCGIAIVVQPENELFKQTFSGLVGSFIALFVKSPAE